MRCRVLCQGPARPLSLWTRFILGMYDNNPLAEVELVATSDYFPPASSRHHLHLVWIEMTESFNGDCPILAARASATL